MERQLSQTLQAVLAVVGLVIAVVALTPGQWTKSLGSWAALLRKRSRELIAVALLSLSVTTIYRQVANPFPISSFPVESFTRLYQVVNDGNSRGGEHEVRAVLATGDTTLGPLQTFLRDFSPQAEWRVRILLMNPDSPLTAGASPQWPIEACRSVIKLQDLEREFGDEEDISIEWRTYDAPPMMRGVDFDQRQLFLGFFEWRGGRLQHQEKDYMYFSRGQDGHDYLQPIYDSWFEHQWSTGASRWSSEPSASATNGLPVPTDDAACSGVGAELPTSG